MTPVRVGDWVTTKEDSRVGIVKRAAKNGSWVDVDWNGWTKRMKPEYLVVRHTIPFGDGTVTDVHREQELSSGQGK